MGFKKLAIFLILNCFTLLIFSGCDLLSIYEHSNIKQSENSESLPLESSSNVDQILTTALDGDFPILSQAGRYEKLPDYLASHYYAAISAYAYVDFNGDGQNEMIVKTDAADAANVVLYYNGEDVFFFLFPYEQMQQIKIDGSFSGSTVEYITYSSLEFTGGGYRLNGLAQADRSGTSYTVDGVACDEQTFVAFEKEWALKQNISWISVEYQPIVKPETQPATEPPTTPAEPTPVTPYRINIPDKHQAIYSGPAYHFTYVGEVGIAGIYTIVEEAVDIDNNLWGKMKSGIGWVDLNDIRRSDNPIVIDYADSALLASGNFHRAEKLAGAHSTAVSFCANQTLYNVQIFYNTYNYDYSTENGYELFYLQKLTTDKPIVVAITFTDTSEYLISFEDSYGNFYMYEFYESGSDLAGMSGIITTKR